MKVWVIMMQNKNCSDDQSLASIGYMGGKPVYSDRVFAEKEMNVFAKHDKQYLNERNIRLVLKPIEASVPVLTALGLYVCKGARYD